jgi:hypothetical protein
MKKLNKITFVCMIVVLLLLVVLGAYVEKDADISAISFLLSAVQLAEFQNGDKPFRGRNTQRARAQRKNKVESYRKNCLVLSIFFAGVGVLRLFCAFLNV